jgi:AraC family transcriptional regulator
VPVAGNPGSFLRGGEFFSPVQARLRTDEVMLSELRQPVSRSVPRHEHELAYVTVMLCGDYLEGDRGKLDEVPPFTAVFNPAGASHSTLIGPAGASLFTIELREENLRHLGVRLPRRTTFDRGTGDILWPGLRLYSAFKAQTSYAQVQEGILEASIVEAHLLELLGAIAGVEKPSPESKGFESKDKLAPLWFGRAKERLHDGFREPLRMRDLAREAGVHPVHLARVFRRFEKRTPGEYQQRLQLRAACELLRDPEWPLAVIAAECGFSDQSHFTRIFRRMAGTTPAQFRRAVTSRVTAT